MLRRILLLAGALVTSASPSGAVPDFTADYSGQIAVVARRDFPSPANHLDVEGHFAFVGTFDDGVVVFNLSDPENPVQVGSAPVPDVVEGVTARGDVLYVAARTAGVFVFDVSRPDDPVLLGSVDTPGYARRIALSPSTGAAQLAYVAGDWMGVQVIDVGVPSAPTIVGSLDTDRATGVAYQDGYLYVADDDGGVLVLDVSVPANPHVVGVADVPGSIEVAVAGASLFVGGEDFFQICDVSDPTAPLPRGRAEIGGYYGNGYRVAALHVEGEVADLAAREQGLYLADVSDDDDPVIFSGIRARSTTGVDRMGPWIVLAHSWGGMGSIQVVDSRGRPSPAPVGFAGHDGDTVVDVAIDGDTAYTVGGAFRVLDVADPTQPEILGGISTYYGSWEVAVAEPPYVVFVETTAKRLNVVDVSVPTSPQLVGSIAPAAVYDLHGLEVIGRYAYVGARLRPESVAGLAVFDLVDPTNPVLASTLPLPDSHAMHVEISGNIAYVVTSGGFGHLALVDVTDPVHPALLSTLEVGGGRDVRVRDDLAYLAIDYVGLEIVDVSDPLGPQLLSTLEAAERAHDVDLDGDFAYVASLWWGMNVVDVSDPAHPVLLGATMVPPDQVGVVGAVEFHDGLTYCGGNYGLAILPRHAPSYAAALAAPVREAASDVLTGGRPNPFRSMTSFAFRASRPGDARVAVYDVAGRLVRVLLDGRVDAGRHALGWDGTDTGGRAVSSGVYFVRLDAESGSSARKIQRIR